MLRAVLAIVLVFITRANPAAASIIYNYNQHWMFDSSTELYWQYEQIPSSTFAPASGRIANVQEVEALGREVGTDGLLAYSGGMPPVQDPYNSQLANLLAFFEHGAPTPSRSAPFLAPLDFTGVVNTGVGPPGFEYQYMVFDYAPADLEGVVWNYFASITTGTYGPQFCVQNPCAPTQGAFVVSTVAPVPIPAAVWLMLPILLAYARLNPGRRFEQRSRREDVSSHNGMHPRLNPI